MNRRFKKIQNIDYAAILFGLIGGDLQAYIKLIESHRGIEKLPSIDTDLSKVDILDLAKQHIKYLKSVIDNNIKLKSLVEWFVNNLKEIKSIKPGDATNFEEKIQYHINLDEELTDILNKMNSIYETLVKANESDSKGEAMQNGIKEIFFYYDNVISKITSDSDDDIEV